MVLKKFPHVYVLLFGVLIVSALLTPGSPATQHDLHKTADVSPGKLVEHASYHP